MLSTLKGRQGELVSLWGRARDLVKDSTDEEKAETLDRLQDVQDSFDSALRRHTHKLQDLQKALVTRKYFKMDLEKMCDWLRKMEALTFPEIDLKASNMDLQSLLTKYRAVLEQASEYENLLLIVQRTGQEILPTLSEVEHGYLDEKLNALPQQYHSVLVLAKLRHETVQQASADQRNFHSLMETAQKTVRELQEQFEAVEKKTGNPGADIAAGLHGDVTAGVSGNIIAGLRADLTELLSRLVTQDFPLAELRRKRVGLRGPGHTPSESESLDRLLKLCSGLKHRVRQKLRELDQTLRFAEQQTMKVTLLESELKGVKEHLSKLDPQTQSSRALTTLHSLAQSLEVAEYLLQALSSPADTQNDQQVALWQEELLSLKETVIERITSCEGLIRDRGDLHTEMATTLGWLRLSRDDLGGPLNFDELTIEKIENQCRTIPSLQEEVLSKAQIIDALANKAREKHSHQKKQLPDNYENILGEIKQLKNEVLQALSSKQSALARARPLVQQYHSALACAQRWLGAAAAFLEQASAPPEPEELQEHLREWGDIQAQEEGFRGRLEALEALCPQLQAMVDSASAQNLKTCVESVCLQGSEVREQLMGQQEILHRRVAVWRCYEAVRGEIISRLDEVERSMAEFTTARASSTQEAHSKLEKHKGLGAVLASLEGMLAELRARAGELAEVGIGAGAARYTEVLCQRWTRLRNAARYQERALHNTAQEWSNFDAKVEKVQSVAQELQGRVPEGAAENAASRAALQSLLEYQDCFCLEVERERGSLVLLEQKARDLPPPLLPSLPLEPGQAQHAPEQRPLEDQQHYISCLQEQYNRLLEKVCVSREEVVCELAERKSVCQELSLVKSCISDTHTLLLSPSADLDTLLIDLEAAREEVCVQRRRVEGVCQRQQLKYEALHTHVPPEIHTHLTHLTLALDTAEEQVVGREQEVVCVREVKEELASRTQALLEELSTMDSRLQERSTTLEEAQQQHKSVCEDLERCSRSLEELGVCVKELGDQKQNQLLLRQISPSLSRLDHAHTHTAVLAEERSARLLKAEEVLQEYAHTCSLVAMWAEEAESTTSTSISWSQSAQLQQQIHTHQSLLRRCGEVRCGLEVLEQKASELSDVLRTTSMRQQGAALRKRVEQLQHTLTDRLHSMQEAATDIVQLESRVKALRDRLEETQSALTCPQLARTSLRQQLAHRQVLLREVEEAREQCEGVERELSALRLSEEVLTASPLCHTATSLQGATRHLQHSLIQQCNILQEAVLQQAQYEQEVRQLQRLVKEAHRMIQDRPVATGNTQELQMQIQHHEELSKRVQGYQAQIWGLNSRSRMLTVKAKHATMLLALSEVGGPADAEEGGLSGGLEELGHQQEEEEEEEEEMARHPSAHPSVVMMTAGRCHTLLSPVTEESGEEGTNSEVSSPPVCRSPSPADQGSGKASMLRAPPPEVSDSASPESSVTHTHLDDLQHTWDTLKNVISEKQTGLYEALARHQRYQESLQSVSAKMEAIEAELNQALDHSRSPESQMATHQALLDEMVMLQEEIVELQECFSEDLHGDELEGVEQQQAVQSTLTVLGERMATIRMKASGKRQLLEERLSDQLEEQRQEQVLQRCHSEAEELDHWLLNTRATLSSALQPHPQDMDMEEQLMDCQNMLIEIEGKVWCLSELSVHSESLLLEGRSHTRGEAGQLSQRLQGLKASLLDLQRILQDKQLHIQGSLQEQEDSESDSTLSQSPALHDWLTQTTSRGQHHQHMQRHRELEEDLAEQKKLLQFVASKGEEILTQKTTPVLDGHTHSSPSSTPTGDSQSEELQPPPPPTEATPPQEQLRTRWETLKTDMKTKLQLGLNATPHTLVCQHSRVTSPGGMFRKELTPLDCPSPKTLFRTANQLLEEAEGAVVQAQAWELQLCAAVSVASCWLDSAESRLLSGPMLLSDDTETQLCHLEALAREVSDVDMEVRCCREMLKGGAGLMEETVKGGVEQMEETLGEGGVEQMEETLGEGGVEQMEETLGEGGVQQMKETQEGGAGLAEKVLEGGAGLMQEVLETLQERLALLSSTLTPRYQQMTHTLQQSSLYQAELRQLSSALSESRKQLQQKLIGSLDRPASRQMESVVEAEECLRELELRVEEAQSKAETLQPDYTSSQELLRVQDCYEELVELVGCGRSRMLQQVALKGQYERALQDLAELLDTAQDKMAADQKISVANVMDVQMLLDKHKEFFGALEGHVYLTGAWFGQLRNVLGQRELQAHEDMIGHAHNILKQAHKRGIELEAVLEAWTGVVKDYQVLCVTLEKVESSIPTAALLEETQECLTHRIALYQRLKSSLSGQQQQLYGVLEEGKRLLLSVCCAELEQQLTQLGDRWLHTSTRVNKEIQRLDATLTHWSRYERQSAELAQWLRCALQRLDFWNNQSVTVPQELESVRDHLHAFLEFSKEVEARSALQAAVLSSGSQLLRLKRVDTAPLRAQIAQLDSQWTDLLTRIPVVQEKLHQLQMEKLSSREAIAEVMSWISLMENAIQEDQQSIMGALGSESISNFLQKYKGFRIDLTCKQLTVDFVNGSVLQMSSQDVEAKRSDKTDFAERLGAMNRRWSVLQGLVSQKIQVLEALLESWQEHEGGVNALGAWLNTQEEKLKRRRRLEDIASVHNALKDTQELEECLQEKCVELSRAEERASLLTRDKRPDACAVVMETLTGLKQSWTRLDQMLSQVKVNLKEVLEQWSLHKRVYEEISGYLIEGRYSISRLTLLNGSPSATHTQVESLEALQRELEAQEGSLAKFSSTTQTLLDQCHPCVSHTLTHTLSDVTLRWNSLLEQISEQLRSSRALLQLWRRYEELHTHTHTAVRRHEEKAQHLLNSASQRDVTGEEVLTWIHACSELLSDQEGVQVSLQEFQEVAEQLEKQVEPIAMATFHSSFLSLSQRLETVEHTLCRQQAELQGGCEEVQVWEEELDSLTRTVEEVEEELKEATTHTQEHMDKLRAQMLTLSGRSPDVERLNEQSYTLALSDTQTHTPRLQSLNRRWNTHSASTIETYSKLQAACLEQQSFLEKCESWMHFLSTAELRLAPAISGSYASLLEQQRQHEMFQAEVFSQQQILYSIIADGHTLLDQGQMENREDFVLKVALLSQQWQGVVRRAQQRRGLIDELLRQWERYRHLLDKLRRCLEHATPLPHTSHQGEPLALQQARLLLHHIQVKERLLQRQQSNYVLAVDAGRQLLLSVDSRSEARLQAELAEVQEQWRTTILRLDEKKKELHALLKDWERCEKGILASQEKLRVFKRKLSLPLPEHHDELHTEQIHCKELEGSMESWPECVLQLCELKESLSTRLRPHDLCVLQERLDLLHSQWDEISHQVCVRRAQVCERLNEWAVFSEKSKELCDWLTQMETKVSQNADISIQDMIDKLRKEYQEEISVAEENRQHLQQMGERLARASHQSKAAEINYKLSKANERWQHLLDLIAARVKKLKETLLAVQQLDKNMSNLRSWLAHIETELSRPIVYQTCDPQEIQHKLDQQQDLQRDIEKQSAGVASVLSLCEVLLHDCDACASESECESIQQATRHLDRRWRNICAVAMERRLKIEETGRLWHKFLEDFGRFEEWLRASERTAARPNSSGVTHTLAKEELKRFEAFQRQVQECLTQLELINKQYRRLARENRTDASGRLRDTVHDGNRRWDALQRRVAAILRRLKHFIVQREEFESSRDGILVWLTEMDLQLTNIEHFSECDTPAKIKQLRAFQQEMSLNAGRLAGVFGQGRALLCRSEPLDAAVIEDELEELRRYCMEVFGRVERYYRRLTRLPLSEDYEGSDRELDLEESSELMDLQWEESTYIPRPPTRPSGRDTPASIESLPLEWDHDFDLEPMGSTISPRPPRGTPTPPQRRNISPAPPGGTPTPQLVEPMGLDVVIPESPEAYIRLTHDTLRSSSGEPGQQEELLQPLDSKRYHLQPTEGATGRLDSSTPELDSPYMGYMRLMGDGRGSIMAIKRGEEEELEDDEDDLSALTNPDSSETHSTGVIERWEILQAQSHLQPWQQLTSDLDSMEAWLSGVEEELNQLRGRGLSTDINTIQQRIRKLKELQTEVDAYRPTVLSINLSGVELAQSGGKEAQEQEEVLRRLKEVNGRWEALSSSLGECRRRLQGALMQCQEFHELSHALLLWLEEMDRRRNQVGPIAPPMDTHTIQAHTHTLTEVFAELKEVQQRVEELQELSEQLLEEAPGGAGSREEAPGGAGAREEVPGGAGAREEAPGGAGAREEVPGGGTRTQEQEREQCEEARERVHVIASRLRTLLRAVTSDLQLLRSLADSAHQQSSASWSVVDEPDASAADAPSSRLRTPRSKSSSTPTGAPTRHPHLRSPGGSGYGSSPCEERSCSSSQPVGSAVAPHCHSFFLRVLRAALPLQLLLLLVLALACLVPMSEYDYSCHHANNFARSFHPMLRYTNGPPPI
ncbi:hypothetical protein ACEWY4_022025 [Coilia grayii]|uniref:KASH domain-containing protein n=1 Tax=Coilia grayii TaxID=363190 RepID=A0ABD1J4U1_9TELE